jgi:hypothetical protein
MEYLKYLGYSEQEVGFVALDRASQWGLLLAGPASPEVLKFMESGDMEMPDLQMTRVTGVFSFGRGKKVSWEETMESINDEDEGGSLQASAKDFYTSIRKVNRKKLFKAIFSI